MAEDPKRCRITFSRTGQACEVDVEDTLVDATFRYELPIRYRCERAVCTTCLIEVLEGGGNLSEATDREKQTLAAIQAKPHWRLACQVQVLGDVALDYIPVTDERRKREEPGVS